MSSDSSLETSSKHPKRCNRIQSLLPYELFPNAQVRGVFEFPLENASGEYVSYTPTGPLRMPIDHQEIINKIQGITHCYANSRLPYSKAISVFSWPALISRAKMEIEAGSKGSGICERLIKVACGFCNERRCSEGFPLLSTLKNQEEVLSSEVCLGAALVDYVQTGHHSRGNTLFLLARHTGKENTRDDGKQDFGAGYIPRLTGHDLERKALSASLNDIFVSRVVPGLWHVIALLEFPKIRRRAGSIPLQDTIGSLIGITTNPIVLADSYRRYLMKDEAQIRKRKDPARIDDSETLPTKKERSVGSLEVLAALGSIPSIVECSPRALHSPDRPFQPMAFDFVVPVQRAPQILDLCASSRGCAVILPPLIPLKSELQPHSQTIPLPLFSFN